MSLSGSLSLISAVRDRIEKEFLSCDYDHSQFPAIAESALHDAELHRTFRLDFDELTRWLLEPDHIVPEKGLRVFSDMPIPVTQGNGFYVEILVWTTGTPSIHQHSFSGAFSVLQGSSIQSRFQLETLERVSNGLQIVRCELERAELLKAGDVCRIDAGSGLTHSVFHLDEPTVSLVVRTNHEPWAAPQLVVFRPHYAVAPEWLYRDGQLEALTRAFRTMSRLSDPAFIEIAGGRLAELDLPRAILLLNECVDLFLGPHLAGIVARVQAAHGRRARFLDEVIRRSQHQTRIQALRHITVDEPDRFALAAMMIAQNHAQARTILNMHPRGEALITESPLPAMTKLWAELAD